MARLALTVAGAVVGGIIGSVVPGLGTALGIELGTLLGGLIGQLAFPGKGTHMYGPRVSDLSVSSSAPGSVIPFLWGTMRLGGQIIWSTGLQETTTTTSQSAKGMPSATSTTYTYSVSFAVGFCQGPATITRIWGDSKLIYNKGGATNTNRGTWSGATLYHVNDLVEWTDGTGTTLTYICMVENTNQIPSNGSYWAEDLVDSAAAVTKYSAPTLYPGSETQNSDPTIVANEGADVTPAYRGLCYAKWENFPLADFGNRLPNLRAEATSNGAAAFPLTVTTWPHGSTYAPFYVISDSTDLTLWVYQGLANGGTDVNSGLIVRMDQTTNEIVSSGIIDCGGFQMTGRDSHNNPKVYTFLNGTDQVPGYAGTMTVDAAGYLWGAGTCGGRKCLFKLDPWTFRPLQAVELQIYTDSDGSGQGVCNDVQAIVSVILKDGTNYLVGTGTGFSSDPVCFVIGAASGGNIIGQYYGFSTPISQTYPVCDDQGNAFILWEEPLFSGVWHVTKINWLSGAVLPKGTPPLPRGPILTNVSTHTYSPDATLGTPRAMFYDGVDSSLVFMTNVGAFLKLDATSFTELDRVGSDSEPLFGCSADSLWQRRHIYSGTLGYDGSAVGGPGNIVQSAFKGQVRNGVLVAPSLLTDNFGLSLLLFNAATFEQISEVNLASFSASGSPPGSNWPDNEAGQCAMLFDPIANALVTTSIQNIPGHPGDHGIYRAYLERLSTSGLTADVIVSQICAAVGMKAGDVDTTQLSAISVQGYPVVSLQAAKDMITVLGQAYFFEACESDFKLKFVPRGQSSLLTIPEQDLGLAGDNAALTEMIGQEQDVPKSVEVLYTNPTTDFQQGQQKRIRHSKTKKTVNQTSISLPLVMNAVQAAQLADKILWTAENERRTYTTNFWKSFYMLLDPCDVITFDYHGVALVGRVTENTIGQNFGVAAHLTGEDSNSYVSVATGNNGTYQGQVIQGLAKTILWLLDIPYLQDLDADGAGNTGYYFLVAPNGANASWPAGVLYSSSDNLTFAQVDASTSQVAYGIALNALGIPADGVFAWDFDNTLTIRMSSGSEPLSDTMLNVLNGTNAAIMYPSLEVIQFTTVVDNGDGTLTLSGLLRGRRGTDDFIGNHSIGETIFFPQQGGIKHEQISLSVLNLLRYYKGITVGADLNSNPTSQSFTVKGRDLMPYAPAGVTATHSGGDLLLTWLRRTRLGGGWNDGIGFVPLNEASESYDVEVVNGAGVVKRTFAAITPPGGVTDGWTSPSQPNKLYTSAQQTADGYTVGTGWTINVYQNSAAVGRGFVSTLALP